MPYRAHLIVMDVGKAFAKVRVIDVTLLNDLTAAVPQADVQPLALPEDAPVMIRYNVGARKYAVHRKSDGERVHEGFAIKEEAVAWALQHIAAMAG
jgi:hypothetical protein